MARPAIPLDVIRVAVEGQQAGHPWVNTFWCKGVSSGTPTGTQMNSFAHAFLAAFAAMWSQVANASASVEQCIAEWNDGSGNFVPGTDATLTLGTGSQGLMPANCAWVVSWRTSQRYRGGHPRSYLAGIDTIEQNDPVSWKSSGVSSLQSLVNTFLAAVNGYTGAPFSSMVLGNLRQFANGGSETVPKTYLNPPTFHAFTGGIVKPGIATQRRRLGDNFS